MKEFFKAAVGVCSLSLLVTAMPIMAAEVDVDGANTFTGANSDNINHYDVDNSGNAASTNNGSAVNSASASVQTGNNDQNNNTDAGNLDTGAINATTQWQAMLNSGAALAGIGESQSVMGMFTNNVTGSLSDNRNVLDIDNTGDIQLVNSASVLNILGLGTLTGNNNQNNNTDAGSVMTGGVGLNSAIDNQANNETGFGPIGVANSSVHVTASNSVTGFDSLNRNRVDIDNSGTTSLTNNAALNTQVQVQASTGGNDQNNNTQGGSLDTGNVSVTTDVVNKANNGSSIDNAGSVANVTGDFTNGTTGSQSDNRNTLNVDNSGSTTVTNNASSVSELNVGAETGGNDQNNNTTGGDVNTGDVSINFNTTTQLNNND